MGFETAAEPPVRVRANGQQSQLCPRPTKGSSKLLRCIEGPLLEQLSPESAKQCIMLISLKVAKLSVQLSWDVEQGKTDRYACRTCNIMTCTNSVEALWLTAIRHKLMPRWKLATSITANSVCRRWLMTSLRDAVNHPYSPVQTWLLVKLTPKGVVFSFLFFLLLTRPQHGLT